MRETPQALIDRIVFLNPAVHNHYPDEFPEFVRKIAHVIGFLEDQGRSFKIFIAPIGIKMGSQAINLLVDEEHGRTFLIQMDPRDSSLHVLIDNSFHEVRSSLDLLLTAQKRFKPAPSARYNWEQLNYN